MPSSTRKMCEFTSSRTCAKSHMCKKSHHFISPLSAKRIIGGRYQTGKPSPDVSGIVPRLFVMFSGYACQ